MSYFKACGIAFKGLMALVEVEFSAFNHGLEILYKKNVYQASFSPKTNKIV